MSNKRIGILGGTFNPVHFGHLYLSEAAYDKFNLNKVLLMPSPNPPHKNPEDIISIYDRCEMVKLAVQGNLHLEFSDFELKLRSPSYTYQTLKAFKEEFPYTEIFFIIGGDSLFSIDSWRCPQKIFESATILVGKRKNERMGAKGSCKPYLIINGNDNLSLDDELNMQIIYLKEKYHAEIHNLYMSEIDISSSEIIDRLRAGESVKSLLPESVADYIAEKKLFV